MATSYATVEPAAGTEPQAASGPSSLPMPKILVDGRLTSADDYSTPYEDDDLENQVYQQVCEIQGNRDVSGWNTETESDESGEEDEDSEGE